MAQYLFDYRDGSTPNTSDWSFRQGNGSHRIYAAAGFLALESGNPGTKVVAFSPIDGANNVEALVRFYLSQNIGKQGIISLRYGGNTEANTTGYTLSGSVIGDKRHIAVDEGGSGNVAWLPWEYVPNKLYWARFRVHDDKVMAKVWNDGQDEPVAWMIYETNKVRPTGSYSGLHTYMLGTVKYSFISFGTDGDTAPRTVSSSSYTTNARVGYPQAPSIETPGLYWSGFGGPTVFGGGGYGTVTIQSYTVVSSQYVSKACIEGTEATRYEANATIQSIQDSKYLSSATVEHQLSSVYKSRATIQHELAVNYRASGSLSVNLSVDYIAGAELDSWHIPGSSSYGVSARIEGKTELKCTTSAIVEEINRGNYVVSGIIVDEKSTTYTSGAIVVQESSTDYLAGSYIGNVGDVLYTTNACIEHVISTSYMTNGYISEIPGIWQESQNGTAQAWNENTNGMGQVWQETQGGTAQSWSEDV